ncbi:hypothetical protein GEV33_001087 [Tenebrio molitor]|uniref:Uncharacterized protein n=1 Tax=Tenebrio molitor TaxID=7067 RepID=A0A8J6HVZ5_TENMO|nr:hypothetical protein GEV33_001087 [Tenebrio molitor]
MAARNSKTPTSPHQPASNPNIRYLGVTFSQNCTFTQDLNEILNKARNIANLLYRIRGRIRDCDPKTLYHTYKSFIRLVITNPLKHLSTDILSTDYRDLTENLQELVDSIPLCRPSTTLGLPRTSVPELGSPHFFCGYVSFLCFRSQDPNEPPAPDRTAQEPIGLSKSRMATNDSQSPQKYYRSPEKLLVCDHEYGLQLEEQEGIRGKSEENPIEENLKITLNIIGSDPVMDRDPWLFAGRWTFASETLLHRSARTPGKEDVLVPLRFASALSMGKMVVVGASFGREQHYTSLRCELCEPDLDLNYFPN